MFFDLFKVIIGLPPILYHLGIAGFDFVLLSPNIARVFFGLCSILFFLSGFLGVGYLGWKLLKAPIKCIVLVCVWPLLVKFSRWSRSTILDGTLTHLPLVDPSDFVTSASVVDEPIKAASGHSHPLSAGARGKFYDFLRSYFGKVHGQTIGVLQPARRDFDNLFGRNTVQFDMKLDWPCDLQMTPRSYAVPNHFEVIVDTDYYIDIAYYLAKPRTVFLYTVQPDAPSKTTPEYSYYFSKDGTLHYTLLSTNDKFSHKVWNWKNGSYFVAASWFWCTVYKVFSKRIDDDHYLVALYPVRYGGFWGSIALQLMGFVDRTEQYDTYVSRGGHALHHLFAGENVKISPVNFLGDAVHHVSFSTEQVSEALAVYNSHKNVSPSALTRIAKTQSSASLLFTYMQIMSGPADIDHFSATRVGVEDPKSFIRYSLIQPNDEDMTMGRPTGVESELITFVPPKGATGAIGAIAGRVQPGRVISKKSKAEQYVPYAEEFATHLVRVHEGPFSLLDPITVEKNLCMPKHKAAREKWPPAYDVEATVTAKLFPKNEPYVKPTNSRAIIDMDHQFKHTYSAVTGSIATALKACDWYAFGVGPATLVDNIIRLSSLAGPFGIVETDYSRFDSTVGGMRVLEQAMLRVMFPGPANPDVLKLWQAQMKVGIFCGNFKEAWCSYVADGERLSGSPETSVLNSIDNALIAYITLRKNGLDPDAAWDGLGLYGGDDGIMSAEHASGMKKVAADCGLDLKLTMREHGEPFSFLGRYFNCWDGEPYSCYDPVRCLVKVAFCDRARPPQEALSLKLGSLLVTDKTTPWVVNLVNKYVDFYGATPKEGEVDINMNYYAWLTRDTEQVFPPVPIEEYPKDWMIQLYASLVSEQKAQEWDKLASTYWVNGVIQDDPPPLPEIHGKVLDSSLAVEAPPEQITPASNGNMPSSSGVDHSTDPPLLTAPPPVNGRRRRKRLVRANKLRVARPSPQPAAVKGGVVDGDPPRPSTQ